MVLGGVALAVYALVTGTGDTAQWDGYGVGIYSVFSWIQMLKFTDPPTYRLIWGSKTVLLAIFGFGSLSFFTYGYMFWVAPSGIRPFDVAKDVAGLYLGLPAAAASAAGVIIGVRLSALWKDLDVRGRAFVCMVAT